MRTCRALIGGLVLTIMAAPAFAEPLKGDQIKKLIAGNTLKAEFKNRRGNDWHVFLHFIKNGKVKAVNKRGDNNGADWNVKGTILCVKWTENTRWPSECFTMEKTGDNKYKQTDEHGKTRKLT